MLDGDKSDGEKQIIRGGQDQRRMEVKASVSRGQEVKEGTMSVSA